GVVAALGRGGAVVVGLDVALGTPSAPGRGGAASDALLAQAAQTVDVVFVVLPATPRSAVPETKIGHIVAEPDVDGVARAVPLWLPLAERPVPALGLALASALTGRADLRAPTDARGRVLAALAAWLLLAARWWAGLAGVVVLAVGYAAALPLALATTGLALPVVTPLGAIALASVGGLVGRHLASGARMRRLEEENARVRETLVRHESAVESLEEDLETARAAAVRSSGAERDRSRAAEA